MELYSRVLQSFHPPSSRWGGPRVRVSFSEMGAFGVGIPTPNERFICVPVYAFGFVWIPASGCLFSGSLFPDSCFSGSLFPHPCFYWIPVSGFLFFWIHVVGIPVSDPCFRSALPRAARAARAAARCRARCRTYMQFRSECTEILVACAT